VGTIHETRFEARQGWLWGSLAVLFLLIAAGMAVAAAGGASKAWWGVAVFAAVSQCFAAFARIFSRDRQRSFNRAAEELEDQLRTWASDPL